jgi:hypothetical protein
MTATQYADVLTAVARRPQANLRNSTLGHQEALEELWDVWHECREGNWDGYTALAVDQETYRGAYTLIESLPLGFPRPSIGAEPDGQLTLEWYKSPRRCLSVSVDPYGLLHYAGLYGPNKRYGTLTFVSTAPSELIQLVRDI